MSEFTEASKGKLIYSSLFTYKRSGSSIESNPLSLVQLFSLLVPKNRGKRERASLSTLPVFFETRCSRTWKLSPYQTVEEIFRVGEFDRNELMSNSMKLDKKQVKLKLKFIYIGHKVVQFLSMWIYFNLELSLNLSLIIKIRE